MFTKFIKRLVKDYVDSRIGNVEYKVKSFEEKVFMEEKKSDPFDFVISRSFMWGFSKPQSLEQRIKDMELKMEALEKHLKVSINFESSEGFEVRKQNQKKQ